MLRCSDVGAELDAYLDGELEEARAREVAAHLEACPACADALAERRRVSLALKRLPAACRGRGLTWGTTTDDYGF